MLDRVIVAPDCIGNGLYFILFRYIQPFTLLKYFVYYEYILEEFE